LIYSEGGWKTDKPLKEAPECRFRLDCPG